MVAEITQEVPVGRNRELIRVLVTMAKELRQNDYNTLAAGRKLVVSGHIQGLERAAQVVCLWLTGHDYSWTVVGLYRGEALVCQNCGLFKDKKVSRDPVSKEIVHWRGAARVVISEAQARA